MLQRRRETTTIEESARDVAVDVWLRRAVHRHFNVCVLHLELGLFAVGGTASGK